MDVNVCVPVLNSYETLEKCIASVNASSVYATIYVLDNGGRFDGKLYPNLKVINTPYNLGVAGSWNWFIKNVPEIRIICNDDVEFSHHAIEDLIAGYNNDFLLFPQTVESMNSFSCYLLPQKIINTIGLFDEEISPNYGYFEDNDYHLRMRKAGFDLKGIPTDVRHAGSSTLKKMNALEQESHHKKFRRARENYVRKWGGEPGSETFSEPYNGK